MFFRLFAFLAVLAVAFASPKPDPQLVTYTGGVLPLGYTGYTGYTAPLTYAAPYAALPYPYAGYYVR